jgi:hypothetical protein
VGASGALCEVNVDLDHGRSPLGNPETRAIKD